MKLNQTVSCIIYYISSAKAIQSVLGKVYTECTTKVLKQLMRNTTGA